jgi:hypothetical protein
MELELSVRGWSSYSLMPFCGRGLLNCEYCVDNSARHPVEKVQREKLKFRICATPSVTRMCDALKNSALEEICEMV